MVIYMYVLSLLPSSLLPTTFSRIIGSVAEVSRYTLKDI